MKRFLSIIALLSICVSASAQVTREVEVTKQYVPKLPPARKLDIATDKQDTVNIRPEIDYTIAPKSFASALTTSKFRPATVTYWEYNKRYPFYAKLGAGFPLASEGDVYVSTERADVGYLTGYINHRGQFSNIKGDYTLSEGGDVISYGDNSAQQMVNRIGFNGGKYIGRYTLDGDIYYQSDIYHRYPQVTAEEMTDEVNFENAAVKLSFGDSFSDMSKINFSLYASADYYNDKSEQIPVAESEQMVKFQQFSTAVGVKAGRNLAQCASVLLSVDYQGYYGSKSLSDYSDNIISASLLFNYNAKRILSAKAGLTYSYDHLPYVVQKKRNHIFPHLYVGADIFENGALVPYVEADGELVNNSYQQLQRLNPYVAVMPYFDSVALPNTEIYNVRLGLSGHIGGSKLAYRLYGNIAFVQNSLYWYSPMPAFLYAKCVDERVMSLEASLEYKPISHLYISAAVKALSYSQKVDLDIANCKPSLLGEFNIRYNHRKFVIGATADVVGSRAWSVGTSADMQSSAVVEYPAYVDLGLTFDWFVGKRCTLYVEGRNLTNAKIYHWALYKEYGAGGIVGVKVQF